MCSMRMQSPPTSRSTSIHIRFGRSRGLLLIQRGLPACGDRQNGSPESEQNGDRRPRGQCDHHAVRMRQLGADNQADNRAEIIARAEQRGRTNFVRAGTVCKVWKHAYGRSARSPKGNDQSRKNHALLGWHQERPSHWPKHVHSNGNPAKPRKHDHGARFDGISEPSRQKRCQAVGNVADT